MSHGENVDTTHVADAIHLLDADEIGEFDHACLLGAVDLSDVTPDVLAGMPESVLAFALRRIRREAADGPDPFSNDYEENPPALS